MLGMNRKKEKKIMQINCENMIVTPNEDGTYKLELLNCNPIWVSDRGISNTLHTQKCLCKRLYLVIEQTFHR